MKPKQRIMIVSWIILAITTIVFSAISNHQTNTIIQQENRIAFLEYKLNYTEGYYQECTNRTVRLWNEEIDLFNEKEMYKQSFRQCLGGNINGTTNTKTN